MNMNSQEWNTLENERTLWHDRHTPFAENDDPGNLAIRLADGMNDVNSDWVHDILNGWRNWDEENINEQIRFRLNYKVDWRKERETYD